jgi:hypothetical protein
LSKLPPQIQDRFDLLSKELEVAGPIRSNWTNFGRLQGTKKTLLYHCHIKSGRPTYVTCWEVIDKDIKLMEVYYVGTHEKAPY